MCDLGSGRMMLDRDDDDDNNNNNVPVIIIIIIEGLSLLQSIPVIR